MKASSISSRIHKHAAKAIESLNKARTGNMKEEIGDAAFLMFEVKSLLKDMRMTPSSISTPPELDHPEINSEAPFNLAIETLKKHANRAIKSIIEAKENASSAYAELASQHIKKAEESLTLVCDLSRTMAGMPIDHINTPPELDQPSVVGYHGGGHANKSRDYFGRKF